MTHDECHKLIIDAAVDLAAAAEIKAALELQEAVETCERRGWIIDKIRGKWALDTGPTIRENESLTHLVALAVAAAEAGR